MKQSIANSRKGFVMTPAQMNEVFPPTPEINVKKRVFPAIAPKSLVMSNQKQSVLEQYLASGTTELSNKLKSIEEYNKRLGAKNDELSVKCNKMESDMMLLKEKYRVVLKSNDETCAKLTNSIMVNSNLTREVYQQNKAFREVMDENTQLHAKLKKQTIIYIE